MSATGPGDVHRSRLVVPPLLLYDLREREFSTHEIASFSRAYFAPAEAAAMEPRLEDISASWQTYLREVIASCATSILVTSLPERSNWFATRLRDRLPPTLARRVRIADERATLFRQMQRYFAPIVRSIKPKNDQVSFALWELGAATYLLLVAIKSNAECHADIPRSLERCDQVAASTVDPEGKARLAVLKSLFQNLRTVNAVPALDVNPGHLPAVAQQIEEILDDAAFLELSVLRRMFSFNANRRAIVRDMRKLVSFVVRNKAWAKVAISATTHMLGAPTSGGIADIASKIADVGEDAVRGGTVARAAVALPPYMLTLAGFHDVRVNGGLYLRIQGPFESSAEDAAG